MNDYQDLDSAEIRNINHQLKMTDRFDNFAEIRAKFNSTGTCGHQIKKGDVIGYNPRTKSTSCPNCWSRWVAENREADAIEAGYMPCCL